MKQFLTFNHRFISDRGMQICDFSTLAQFCCNNCKEMAPGISTFLLAYGQDFGLFIPFSGYCVSRKTSRDFSLEFACIIQNLSLHR